MHITGLCPKALSPKICSLFEICNRCMATIVNCEPVLGGYDCVNETLLYWRLLKNIGSNTITLFKPHYNFDSENGMNLPEVKKFTKEESELKKPNKEPQKSMIQKGNQEVQHGLDPKLQRKFKVKTEVFRLKFYKDKDNRMALIMQNLTKTPEMSKHNSSVSEGEDKEMGTSNPNSNPNERLNKFSKQNALESGEGKVNNFDEAAQLLPGMQNLKREKFPKISKPRISVYKDLEVEMDNSIPDEVLQKVHKFSKRSAFDDGKVKVKGFEKAAEEFFKEHETFQENWGSAANYYEEKDEDPLNKLHEVHCEFPKNGTTYTTVVVRNQTHDVITQKCDYGYTFQEGIERTMICDHETNTLKPKYAIWTDECKPFLNCTVEFIRGGYAKCISALWFTQPICEVFCDYYSDGDSVVEYHICDVHKGWIPDLPSCATSGSYFGLVLPPKPMLHKGLVTVPSPILHEVY